MYSVRKHKLAHMQRPCIGDFANRPADVSVSNQNQLPDMWAKMHPDDSYVQLLHSSPCIFPANDPDMV